MLEVCGEKDLLRLLLLADNALEKHQKYLVSFVVAIALCLVLLVIIDKLNLAPLLPQIFPPIILIYLAAAYDKFIFVSGFFILGLLILLETSGQRSRKKIRQLMIKDLIKINKPALLHVKERNKNNRGVRFSHAVALLKINPKNQQFISLPKEDSR